MVAPTWSQISSVPPPFLRRGAKRGRKRQGVIYEQRGHEEFAPLFGAGYMASPWFRYMEKGRDSIQWCQPDALVLDPSRSRALIVEFKYAHTPQAYFQLFDLYLPVVSRWLDAAPSPWEIAVLEITKWFDPATACPETPSLCSDPLAAPVRQFNVHIWKPRGTRAPKRPPRPRPSAALRLANV